MHNGNFNGRDTVVDKWIWKCNDWNSGSEKCYLGTCNSFWSILLTIHLRAMPSSELRNLIRLMIHRQSIRMLILTHQINRTTFIATLTILLDPTRTSIRTVYIVHWLWLRSLSTRNWLGVCQLQNSIVCTDFVWCVLRVQSLKCFSTK